MDIFSTILVSCLFVGPVGSSLLIWQASLRPYLRKQGLTLATSGDQGRAAWIDWKTARQLSAQTGKEHWSEFALPVSIVSWFVGPALALAWLNR